MRACGRPTNRTAPSIGAASGTRGPMTVVDLINAAQVGHVRRMHGESLRSGSAGAVELSIVVPTYNERDNIPELVERVSAVMEDVAWEMIVVDDDSPDGT